MALETRKKAQDAKKPKNPLDKEVGDKLREIFGSENNSEAENSKIDSSDGEISSCEEVNEQSQPKTKASENVEQLNSQSTPVQTKEAKRPKKPKGKNLEKETRYKKIK